MVMVSRIVVGRDRGEVRLWQPGQPAEIDVRLSARRAPFNRDPSTRLRRVGQTLRRCGLDLAAEGALGAMLSTCGAG